MADNQKPLASARVDMGYPDDLDRHLARERADLAARLHDGPTQELTALRMQVFLLGRKFPESRSEFVSRAQSLTESAEAAVHQIQDMVGELRALSTVSVPFASLLRKCCSAVRNKAGVDFACSRQAEMVDAACKGAVAILDSLPGALRCLVEQTGAESIAVVAFVMHRRLHVEISMVSAPDAGLPAGLESVCHQLEDCGGTLGMMLAGELARCAIVVPVDVVSESGE